MNLDGLAAFAEGYLSGFFGSVGSGLSVDPTYGTGEIAEFSDDSMSLTGTYQAALGGSIDGGGEILMLLQAKDVYPIAAAIKQIEIEPKEALNEDDATQLTVALRPSIEAGAAYFKETHGTAVEFMSKTVSALTEETLHSFQSAGPGAVAEFTFDIPDVTHGKGVLLISETLADAVGEVAPTLTKDEVEDIMSDFDDAGADQEGEGGAAPKQAAGDAQANLGRVLDIQLVATARLGRVEMPIQDILSLGPGSIVEVGHVVDEPVELLVNNKLIARGDVVVVDEKFGLRITEIISPEARIESLS